MRTLVCLLVIAFCTACPADKDKEPVKDVLKKPTPVLTERQRARLEKMATKNVDAINVDLKKIQNSTKARGNALKALDKRRKAKVSPQD